MSALPGARLNFTFRHGRIGDFRDSNRNGYIERDREGEQKGENGKDLDPLPLPEPETVPKPRHGLTLTFH